MKDYKLYLKGGKEYNLSEDYALRIVQIMMVYPVWKKIRIGELIFRVDDIDMERVREEKKPQLKMFDIAPVEKKRKRNME